jgi:hypothetical protein
MNALMIDPRTSPFFRPQEAGEGMASLGNANGAGFLSGLSGLPGAEQFMLEGGGINPDALQAYLSSNGLQLMAEGGDGAESRWVQDAAGNMVVQPEQFQYADRNWDAGLALALGVTGANLLGAGALGGFGGSSAPTAGGVAGGGSAGGAVGGGMTAPAGFTLAPSLGAGTAAGTAAGTTAGAAGGLGSFLTSPGFLGPALSAGIGLYGQNRAINAAQDANAQNLQFQRDVLAQQRADNQPLMDLRNSTLPKINALMQDPSSITQDPGYQFGLNEGNKLLQDRSAASGGYYSGAQLKGAQRFGQDYAGTKLTDSLNRLMGVAGLGQVGGNNNQQATGQYGNNTTNLIGQGGNIRGSGYMGMTNTLGGTVNDWFNNWQRQNGGG